MLGVSLSDAIPAEPQQSVLKYGSVLYCGHVISRSPLPVLRFCQFRVLIYMTNDEGFSGGLFFESDHREPGFEMVDFEQVPAEGIL